MHAMKPSGQDLLWAEAPDPVPATGEVRIRISATAVNRADLLQRRGLYPPPPGASPILGLECSGTVDAVGPGPSRWSVGDRVCALLAGGGYAEAVTVPDGQVLPVPDGLDLAQAAALPEALATAWMALFDEGRLAMGERVLVHAGASGIGTAMVQVCRVFGNPCFVTAGTAAKVALCVSLGADGGTVHADGPWEDAVRRWGAPDLVVDPVAGPYLAQDQRVLAPGGRVVVLGLLGGTTATLDLARLLLGGQRILGTTLRSRPAADKARIVAGVERDLWPRVASGDLRPVVDVTLPIREVEAAHARIATNATSGKVVMTVAG